MGNMWLILPFVFPFALWMLQNILKESAAEKEHAGDSTDSQKAAHHQACVAARNRTSVVDFPRIPYDATRLRLQQILDLVAAPVKAYAEGPIESWREDASDGPKMVLKRIEVVQRFLAKELPGQTAWSELVEAMGRRLLIDAFNQLASPKPVEHDDHTRNMHTALYDVVERLVKQPFVQGAQTQIAGAKTHPVDLLKRQAEALLGHPQPRAQECAEEILTLLARISTWLDDNPHAAHLAYSLTNVLIPNAAQNLAAYNILSTQENLDAYHFFAHASTERAFRHLPYLLRDARDALLKENFRALDRLVGDMRLIDFRQNAPAGFVPTPAGDLAPA